MDAPLLILQPQAIKRRDADGDADSIMLYADALLNFSKKFLSDKIGGLMDAPLLIQPLVLPHESQPQAHNLEVMEKFPIEFYKTTELMPKASDVKSVMPMVPKDRLGSVNPIILAVMPTEVWGARPITRCPKRSFGDEML